MKKMTKTSSFILVLGLLGCAFLPCTSAMKRNANKELSKGEDKKLKAGATDKSEGNGDLSTFFGIPNDIIDHILDDASPSVLWNLRYTSKYFEGKVSSKYLKNLYTDEGIIHYVYNRSNLKSAAELQLALHARKLAGDFETHFGAVIKRLKGCEDINLILKYLDLLPSYNNSKVGSKKNFSFNSEDCKAFLDIEDLEGLGFEQFRVLDISGNAKLMTFYVGEEDPFTIFPLHQIIPAMFTGNQAFGPYLLAHYILPYCRNGNQENNPEKTAFLERYGKYISPGLQSCFHFVRYVKAIIDNTCSSDGRGYISYTTNSGWTRYHGSDVDTNGFILKTFLESKVFLDFDRMSAVFPSISSYRKLIGRIPTKMALRIANMWKFDKKAIALAYYKQFGSTVSPLDSRLDCFPHCYLLDSDVIPEEDIDPQTIISIMDPNQWFTDKVPEVWTILHGDLPVAFEQLKEEKEITVVEETANENPQPGSISFPIEIDTCSSQLNGDPEWVDGSGTDGIGHIPTNKISIQLMTQSNSNFANVQQNNIGIPVYQNKAPVQQTNPDDHIAVLEGEKFDSLV